MVIKSNSVRDINVALLELERRIKTNNDTLQEAVNYVKKYLNNHLNDGSTYNINISGNANTADYAISAGTSNYATSAGSAQSADTANNATHATNADYATSAGSAASATNADYATSAGTAAEATHAANADYASTSGGAAPVFPEGYVYMQLYNPNTASWEKTPAQMGLQVPSGYKWTEITTNFSSYPYIKIGTGTTQSGHNAYHRHTHSHTHSHSHTAYTGCYTTNNEATGYGLGGQPGFQNRVMVSAPSNVGTSTDSTGPSTIYTSYDGSSTEQTVEVNASNMKLWKVVVDE